MRFYFPLLSTKITQCIDAKRLCINIPRKPHFAYVLNFLQTKGYVIHTYNAEKDEFCVFPKYIPHNGAPVLTTIRTVTKPSNRRYVRLHHMKSLVFNRRPGAIHYIVSTRKGFMTIQEAYRLRIGGELMYEIW